MLVAGCEHTGGREMGAVRTARALGARFLGAALLLANETLPQPLPAQRLHELAASLGADIPFFLEPGPKLAEGDGTVLRPVRLPLDYAVVLLVPRGVEKASTGAVYQAFDDRGGEDGFDERRAALSAALEQTRRAEDLARLPRNDLASSPFLRELERLGAFRADVTGAGPAVYGLFSHPAAAQGSVLPLGRLGAVWVTEPAW